MPSTCLGSSTLCMDDIHEYRADDIASGSPRHFDFAALHWFVCCPSVQQAESRISGGWSPYAADTHDTGSDSNWRSRCVLPASFFCNVFRGKPHRLATAPNAARTPYESSYHRGDCASDWSCAFGQGPAGVELRHDLDDLLCFDDWPIAPLRNNEHATSQIHACSFQIHTVSVVRDDCVHGSGGTRRYGVAAMDQATSSPTPSGDARLLVMIAHWVFSGHERTVDVCAGFVDNQRQRAATIVKRTFCDMTREFLVIFQYHEPEPRQLFERGVVEDYESTTGVFIVADSADDALIWCEAIAQEVLWRCNDDRSLDWKHLGYSRWIESDPDTSSWSHCLDFFQHVRVGEMPNFDAMGADAYARWQKR